MFDTVDNREGFDVRPFFGRPGLDFAEVDNMKNLQSGDRR
jgi:hypothetical protein